MKQVTLFWIVLGVYLLIGIIGKIIRKESFLENSNSRYGRILIGIGVMLPFIFFILQLRYNYSKANVDHDRVKYHIPCIDSTMELTYRTKDNELWKNTRSKTRDIIDHTKEIEVDGTSIFKETDRFINYTLSQTLVLETTLPGWFRKHSSNYKLLNTSDFFNREAAKSKILLNATQADSVLHSWNFYFVYNCFPIRY